MNRDFPRIITFLRKERKLSQKQAAAELGISQALLSHYEKGIRECGLDFVVKAAEYYNVSCDFLLGRTADRDYDLGELSTEKESHKQSAAQIVSRRLLSSALNAIYDLSAAAKNRKLDRTVTNYFMIAVYRVYRQLYSANENNPQESFTIPKSVFRGYADAVMTKLYADLESMTDNRSESSLRSLSEANMSPELIAEQYPESAGEIFNVIQQAENTLSKI